MSNWLPTVNIIMDCFQLIHIAGVVVLTQMLLHPELYEERYFETYGTAPRSGKYLIGQHMCVGFSWCLCCCTNLPIMFLYDLFS